MQTRCSRSTPWCSCRCPEEEVHQPLVEGEHRDAVDADVEEGKETELDQVINISFESGSNAPDHHGRHSKHAKLFEPFVFCHFFQRICSLFLSGLLNLISHPQRKPVNSSRFRSGTMCMTVTPSSTPNRTPAHPVQHTSRCLSTVVSLGENRGASRVPLVHDDRRPRAVLGRQRPVQRR